MTTNTVTISARISQEDAAFISQLEINGAKTPSDKFRAIISEARQRQESQQNFHGFITLIQDMITPISAHIREAELTQHSHSELVTRTLEWLPDTMAYILFEGGINKEEQSQEELLELESGIADRVFQLMESCLQMGVTQRAPCYDKQAIQSRVEPILDILRVINLTRKTNGENV